MRTLVLLTTEFPFGTKEPFIESELPIMTQYFDRVVSYALYSKGNARYIDYPQNYLYNSINSTKRERLISLPRVFFSPTFWMELWGIVHKRKHILHRIKHLVQLSCYVYAPYKKIVKSIKELSLDKQNDTLYFYGYWLVEHAFLAQILKERFNGHIAFSRAHRYDLYESIDKYEYIPYRNYLCNKLDYIFPISNDGKNLLNTYLGKASIQVSRLGTLDYGENPFKKEEKSICTIVSCSWCVSVKRIHLIIEALAQISDMMIKWVHIGDGPLLNELKLIAEQSLKENIVYEFKGMLSNRDLMNFYLNNSVDMFINVSSSEGIPVSIMEALSFGIPVLATNVGGVSEIVFDSYNGWLLKEDCSIEEIVKRIKNYFILSISDISVLRKQARCSWSDNYSADTNYKRFYSLLTQ